MIWGIFLAVTRHYRGPPRAPRRFPMDNLVSHEKSRSDILLQGIVWRPWPLCFAQDLNLRNDKITKFAVKRYLALNQNFPIVWFPYLPGWVPRHPRKPYVTINLVDPQTRPSGASRTACIDVWEIFCQGRQSPILEPNEILDWIFISVFVFF